MNKRFLSLAITLLVLVSVTGMSASLAAPEDQTSPTSNKVVLTEVQKNEIANLYKDILEKKKLLLTKYVEYGVITEEKAVSIIAHFEGHYKELEKNGFVPNWDSQKGHRKHD